ncbi:MAG: hypothetical protein JWP22_466, partial [Ramlibacter sp.]|nr:hypothetical protein [Ramlibacter sp.]
MQVQGQGLGPEPARGPVTEPARGLVPVPVPVTEP